MERLSNSEDSYDNKINKLVGTAEDGATNLGRINQLVKSAEVDPLGEDEVRFCLLDLEPVRTGNQRLPLEERQRVMDINKPALARIYEQVEVQPSRRRIGMSPLGREYVSTVTYNFSPIGVGFIEFASYLRVENKDTVVFLADDIERIEIEGRPLVPERFTANAILLKDGEMPSGY